MRVSLLLTLCLCLGVASANVTSLSELIGHIEAVEKQFPSENWKSITTRIRKNYYDADAIAGGGRKGIMALLGLNAWDMLIPDRKTHPSLPLGGHVTARVKNQIGAATPIFVYQGQNIDMGHVFAGLDSYNYPRCSSLARYVFRFGKTCTGPATWSGDLGSALACVAALRMNDKTVGTSQYNHCYNTRNSPEDILGNLDGLALAFLSRHVAYYKNKKLSQMVRAYYIHRSHRWRYTLSTHAIGLQWSQSSHRLTQASRTKVKTASDTFAKGFFRKDYKKYFFWSVPFTSSDSNWMANKYIAHVEHNLKIEAQRRTQKFR